MTGIYTIENLVNGKLYVGLSVDIDKRWEEHVNGLNNQTHENSRLQHAWNKYGEDKFRHEVLVECDEQYLHSEEHYWCNMLNVHKRGYNIRPTDPYGRPRHTEESKKKMSQAQKEFGNRPEVRKQRSERMMGKQMGLGHVITPEARVKINEGKKNSYYSIDARKAMGHMKGKTHTEEARKKIGAAHVGKVLTQKQIDSIKERSKGNTYGKGRIKKPKELEKMRIAREKRKEEGWVTPLKGIPRSQEVKDKMKATWEKKKLENKK